MSSSVTAEKLESLKACFKLWQISTKPEKLKKPESLLPRCARAINTRINNPCIVIGILANRVVLEAANGGAPSAGADCDLHGRRRRQRCRPRSVFGHERAGKRQVSLQRSLARERGVAPQQHLPGMTFDIENIQFSMSALSLILSGSVIQLIFEEWKSV